MADQTSKPLQFFVKLLNGKSITLSFSSPLAYGDQIKQRIFEYTKIPTHLQRLISGGYQISDESSISLPETTVNLVLSLRGGKGGFGSLLRGAATKAGQKKTNNFDACRDMSGRRLRHVNAEKRLEEWKEGEEERKLERLANEFLKKQAMKVKQGVGNGATQKYVKKYREESDKCIQSVELALKESFEKNGNGKRKGKKMIVAESGKSKRLKIWKGKRAVEDSDSDDSSEDEEDDDEKSVVLNKDTEESSGSGSGSGSGSVMAGSTHDGESSGKASSGSEEEKEDIVVLQSSDVPNKGEMSDVEAVNEVKMDDLPFAFVDEKDQTEKEENASVVDDAGKNPTVKVVVKEQGNDEPEVKTGGIMVETESVEADCCKTVEPLSFDDFNSATDMEVLGLERLKRELQSRGLKCGGTLQERATRLFLLKSTTLDKLPKKLLAKK